MGRSEKSNAHKTSVRMNLPEMRLDSLDLKTYTISILSLKKTLMLTSILISNGVQDLIVTIIYKKQRVKGLGVSVASKYVLTADNNGTGVLSVKMQWTKNSRIGLQTQVMLATVQNVKYASRKYLDATIWLVCSASINGVGFVGESIMDFTLIL